MERWSLDWIPGLVIQPVHHFLLFGVLFLLRLVHAISMRWISIGLQLVINSNVDLYFHTFAPTSGFTFPFS